MVQFKLVFSPNHTITNKYAFTFFLAVSATTPDGGGGSAFSGFYAFPNVNTPHVWVSEKSTQSHRPHLTGSCSLQGQGSGSLRRSSNLTSSSAAAAL